MTLMEPLLDKGHCLTTDNFYSSSELADILIQSLTDMYGTLKPRRKDVPKELLSKKIDKGQMIAYQRGKVCVIRQCALFQQYIILKWFKYRVIKMR
ncbi:piggyBac transposable element-derived protein 4 [Trichonephila clavipes]|nr:piggyBac transposable element-derived protein 4 [Trichonephila clavipes]